MSHSTVAWKNKPGCVSPCFSVPGTFQGKEGLLKVKMGMRGGKQAQRVEGKDQAIS